MRDLRRKLAEPGILIMDGATGTQLQRMKLVAGMAPEVWNLEQPENIRKHHRAYVEAGSDVILTNTFGGSRPRLDMEGFGHLTPEVNLAAAKLAREVAGDQVLVLGSIGPSGQLMEPMGELTFETAVDYFYEQAAALVEGGVDGIHIETMSDLDEAKAAVVAAHRVTNLPVTVTMSFDMHGRTMMGVRPEDAVKELWALDVVGVGVNCGNTLEENLRALMAMRTAAPEVTLIAKPNAGLPRIENGAEAVYDVTPETMSEYALKFGAQHVKMLGGCCGTTPDHIAMVKRVMNRFEPPALVDVLASNREAVIDHQNGRPQQRRRDSRRRVRT